MKTRIIAMVMASALSAGMLLWQAPALAEEPPADAPKAEGEKKADKKADKKAAKKEEKKEEKSEDKAAAKP